MASRTLTRAFSRLSIQSTTIPSLQRSCLSVGSVSRAPSTFTTNISNTTRHSYSTKTPLSQESLQYSILPPGKDRLSFVPTPRGEVKDVAAFLKAIGRETEQYAAKFETWEGFFSADSEVFAKAGVPVGAKKYIMKWREWFKQGVEPYEIPIPKRQQKHIGVKLQWKLNALKRKLRRKLN